MNASTIRPPTTAAEARAERGSFAPASAPFAALPHALRKDPRLRGRDKAVILAAALLEYARGKPHCWPSNRRLADDLGCSPRSVQIALAALKAAGWVRVEPGGDTPTGRRIVLAWREADCAPSPTPVALDPAQPVAPEGRRERERERPESAAGPSSPPPPAGDEGQEPDLATLHQWAEGPDPILRRIAGRRLAELGGVGVAVAAEAAGLAGTANDRPDILPTADGPPTAAPRPVPTVEPPMTAEAKNVPPSSSSRPISPVRPQSPPPLTGRPSMVSGRRPSYPAAMKPPIGDPEGPRLPRAAAASRRDRGPRGVVEGLDPVPPVSALAVWAAIRAI